MIPLEKDTVCLLMQGQVPGPSPGSGHAMAWGCHGMNPVLANASPPILVTPSSQGLIFTAGLIWKVLQALRSPIHIQEVGLLVLVRLE